MMLALLLLAVPSPAESPEKPGLAVLDLQLKAGLDAGVGELLNDLIVDRLSRSGNFGNVITGSDIRDLLSLEQQKSALGCAEESCLAELGGALGVPLMFSSSLGAFGGKFIINLKLISVEEAKVIARASRVVKDESEILEALPTMLRQVLKEGLGAGGQQAVAAPAPAAANKVPPTKPKARRPSYRRPLVFAGAALLLAAGSIGIGLNQPERGDLSDTFQRFRSGQPDEFTNEPLTGAQYDGIVSDRWQKNMIGTALGSSGIAVVAYALIWGR